jgi:hypothetical protein
MRSPSLTTVLYTSEKDLALSYTTRTPLCMAFNSLMRSLRL